MRILITGVGGFVGRHLARYLLDQEPGAAVHGTVLEPPDRPLPDGVISHLVDLRDPVAVSDLLDAVQPTHIYHVAAQASVKRSFDAAWNTLENNIRAQLNLLQQAILSRTMPRVLVVSSGEIYGSTDPERGPSDEDAPFRPTSPYAVSKIAQDMLALQFHLSHGLAVMRVRPFNHIGPGQSEGFVAPDFAIQVARIEAGAQEPKVYVGSLSARRDFTDVRDVVRAYHLVMHHGVPGEVYNVASGTTRSIQELLETLLRLSTERIEICVVPERMRPASIPVLWGDARRLREATGWEPTIPFEQTLRDVLNDFRERVRISQ